MPARHPQSRRPSEDAPSTQALLKASALAFVVAGLVLVAIVLPAEYGIDPLGTGRALGLTALSGVEAAVPPPQGDRQVPAVEGPFALYPAEYRYDAREFVLGPYEWVEYKYHLEQGASMLFSWQADGDVMHDFHGDPEGAPASAAQSFDARPRREADGSLVAPFTGIHGWYWENPGGDTVTVRLATSGFYTSAHEFRFDGTRQDRPTRTLNTIPPTRGEEENP